MKVIKLGGSTLEHPAARNQLAAQLAAIPGPLIVVHGGGKSVDALQRLLGSEPEKIDGLRRTDPEALRAVLMVLCGELRGELVASLLRHGAPAIGLSGFDGGMIRVRKLEHPTTDLGWVGEVTQVEPQPLQLLLAAGLLPVVSPLSLGPEGQIYNVNADQIAGAIARALGAAELAFVSDVAGVQRAGQPVARLELSEIERLIAENEIQAGMLPKVRAGAQALQAGVAQVRIVDLPGLTNGGGTQLVAGGR